MPDGDEGRGLSKLVCHLFFCFSAKLFVVIHFFSYLCRH